VEAQQGSGRHRFTFLSSEVDSGDVSTRVLLPRPDQPAWLPFKRVAETIPRSTLSGATHPHAAEEVLVYVLEGATRHADADGHQVDLHKGSVLLLTALSRTSHEILYEPGHAQHWVSLVVDASSSPPGESTHLQQEPVGASGAGSDGLIRRPLVGPSSPVRSSVGLEAWDLEFQDGGTAFPKVGRNRRGVLYALTGEGRVENRPVAGGKGVLVAQSSGFTLTGDAGFRVILATAPAPHAKASTN
jgi:redox-sensitive bicupin YhaK (pirin superfamily)